MKPLLHPLRHIIRILLLAMTALSVPSVVLAQPPAAFEEISGTTYVVAFPDTTMNTFDARYPNRRFDDKCFFFIYSAVENTATIKGVGYQRNRIQLKAGGFTIIDLMGSDARAPSPIITVDCRPASNTFRIEAEQPIVVYQLMATKFGTEAWTALPVESWGNEYYAAARGGEIGSDISPGGEFDYNRKNKMFPAEILVIAAYDDTRITIVPNGQIHNFCNPTNVVLKAGEAFQIQSYVDTTTTSAGIEQPDFAGSRIFSTKPVGVISGNTRAQIIDENVGLGKNIFKNMLIEWISPVELHGTEFVYTPSWDDRRPTGAPGEDPSEKRKAEFVRIYGTSQGETQGFYMQGGVATPYDNSILQGRFSEIRHSPIVARVHKTDKPAQAMMQSAAVVKYAGTTNGFGGYIGAAYDGWGGYMVELTPRERWTSFAPFYSSVHIAGMEHFINVVVDSNHRNDVYLKNGTNFIFQRRIEGTDLMWGSMAVIPGVDNSLEGRRGAKFSGWVYGTMARGGHEEYRPGRARNDQEPPDGVHGNAVDDEGVLHPSEYEEILAVAYAYPLASSLNVVGAGDSLDVKTDVDCFGMTIRIESLNENPVGLRSIRLDSTVNTKIVSQTPFPITGAIKATVRIEPIDAFKDASTVVVIKDKTGEITRVTYRYYAEKLNLDKLPVLDFGQMIAGSTVDQTVKATNPLGRALTIKNIRLINGTPGFSIKSPTAFPITIPAGGSIDIIVTANPQTVDRDYTDTLEIELACTKWKLPVIASTSAPCVNVDDLDFGTLAVGDVGVRPLRICNNGSGEVTFNNPSGGRVIEWILNNFSVSAADIDRLAASVLRRGDCIVINVSFASDIVGRFLDTARVWASVRECRDISVWTATVVPPAAAPTETGLSNSLSANEPNPFGASTDIEFTLARSGHATLAVYNVRGERVATLVDAERGAGAHSVRFDATALPAGVYHYRLSIDGWSQSRTMIRQ